MLPFAALALAAEPDDDLLWHDAPGAWHQQAARIVDHRFFNFDTLLAFARNAKKAGVSAIMLVEIQKTAACPGPWYNGLQLCDHINGSYPAPDGSLAQWRQMLDEIRPVRLMWWTNMVYWSVQGQVWAQAKAKKDSDVGRWFSWGPEDCAGLYGCPGRPVEVPGVGCAQGSWGSEGGSSGVESAMASFGDAGYADYLVDAMANSWSRNLGIDGYTEDVSAKVGCMLQTQGKGSMPFFRAIVQRVRSQQPQVVMSGESYGSWDDVVASDANLGGQGYPGYHEAMQRAVMAGDASTVEEVAATSGADAAAMVCYLHPAYDGLQPGGCPTLYYRDKTRVIREVRKHAMWVALEAGSGIVPQHDYGEVHAPSPPPTPPALPPAPPSPPPPNAPPPAARTAQTQTRRAWGGRAAPSGCAWNRPVPGGTSRPTRGRRGSPRRSGPSHATAPSTVWPYGPSCASRASTLPRASPTAALWRTSNTTRWARTATRA